MPARGDSLPGNKPDDFAIRFHLHPTVKASRLTDGHSVMLMLPNREVWTFTAYEDRVEVEESVYLAGHRRTAPRRADRDLRPRAQERRACTGPSRSWSGRNRAPVAMREEPELPL